MRIRLGTLPLLLAFSAYLTILSGTESVTAVGRVVDSVGKPIEHSTVIVYEAGVKKGYSVFCPSCYVDCGKRATTDADGAFTINGLSSELLFTLLVVRDGYSAAYLRKVDPSKGPAEVSVLKSRPEIQNAAQFVRGRIVNAQGEPQPDAVVEQSGVTFMPEAGRPGGMRFGAVDWIDLIAVTNAQGEFEIAYTKPVAAMILKVTARGMASKLFTEPTGSDRKIMTVTQGATVQGRLVRNGKPVANAEVGLVSTSRSSGTFIAEVRIGTQDDGSFAITNVPAGRVWNLYPKMASLADRGLGAEVVNLATKDDGQEIDIGDIELKPARTIRGKVVLSDGKSIPPDTRVLLSADRAWDSQEAKLGADGRFEFRGLPPGVFSIVPAVKGYRLPDGFSPEALVNSDVDDLVIGLIPGSR